MAITAKDLGNIFQYHAPNQDQLLAYAEIRKSAKELSETILRYTSVCADQQAAIRKVREAVMTANAAVALEGKF